MRGKQKQQRALDNGGLDCLFIEIRAEVTPCELQTAAADRSTHGTLDSKRANKTALNHNFCEKHCNSNPPLFPSQWKWLIVIMIYHLYGSKSFGQNHSSQKPV